MRFFHSVQPKQLTGAAKYEPESVSRQQADCGKSLM